LNCCESKAGFGSSLADLKAELKVVSYMKIFWLSQQPVELARSPLA
jgi:hypothetical protein